MRFYQLALLATLVFGCDDKGAADKANEAIKAGEAAKAKAGEAVKAGEAEAAKAAQAGSDAVKAGADAVKAGAEAVKAGGDEAVKAGADAVKAGAEAVQAGAEGAAQAGVDAVKAAEPAVAAAVAGDPLRFVPAETPYVIANTEALPREFADKIGAAIDPILKKFETELAGQKATLTDSPDDKVAKAVIEELEGNLNRAGLEKLGLDPDFRFVLYGLGLMPVLRMELKDGEAFKAAIARVESKSGMKAPTAQAGDLQYWRVSNDGITVVIAIVGSQLVLGVTPDATAEKAVPMILGQQLPDATAATALAATAGKHGFRNTFGYVDATIIASTVMGDGKGLAGEIFAALSKGEAPVLDANCKTEIGGIVAKFPRMAFGYTELSGQKITARYTLETEAGLAAELKGLTAPVPGLGQDDGALLAFGMGINLQKTLDFAKAKAAAVASAPYTCPLLADLNQGFTEMNAGLQAAPIPPFVMGIRGFNVVVKDGKIGPEGPSGIKATAIIAADKANELFEMAKGQVPPLAGLTVPADGTPVALPPGTVPPVVDAPHIAVNANGIAISVGIGEEKGLTALLNTVGAAGPVVAVTYDIKRFLAMMGDQMNAGMNAEEKAMFDAFTGILGTTRYSLELQDAGIVLNQVLTLP